MTNWSEERGDGSLVGLDQELPVLIRRHLYCTVQKLCNAIEHVRLFEQYNMNNNNNDSLSFIGHWITGDGSLVLLDKNKEHYLRSKVKPKIIWCVKTAHKVCNAVEHVTPLMQQNTNNNKQCPSFILYWVYTSCQKGRLPPGPQITGEWSFTILGPGVTHTYQTVFNLYSPVHV